VVKQKMVVTICTLVLGALQIVLQLLIIFFWKYWYLAVILMAFIFRVRIKQFNNRISVLMNLLFKKLYFILSTRCNNNPIIANDLFSGCLIIGCGTAVLTILNLCANPLNELFYVRQTIADWALHNLSCDFVGMSVHAGVMPRTMLSDMFVGLQQKILFSGRGLVLFHDFWLMDDYAVGLERFEDHHTCYVNTRYRLIHLSDNEIVTSAQLHMHTNCIITRDPLSFASACQKTKNIYCDAMSDHLVSKNYSVTPSRNLLQLEQQTRAADAYTIAKYHYAFSLGVFLIGFGTTLIIASVFAK
jgi:hypothetical protein